MNALEELISICRAEIVININQHKGVYESVGEYLSHEIENIDDDVWKEMVAKDTIIEIMAYPRTPIGSVTVYHYDINKAVSIILEDIKESFSKYPITDKDKKGSKK